MLNKLFNRTGGERRNLTTGYGLVSESEALQAARGWLLDGYAVRLLRAGDGTWTIEAWEA